MDLKLCPFCGGPAERRTADDGGQYIACTQCNASTALHYDRCENLEQSWNDRWCGTTQKIGFAQGITWAAAEVCRTFGNPVIAKDLLTQVNQDDLQFCSEDDLEALRETDLIPSTIKGR
jgi:hypothetical protein